MYELGKKSRGYSIFAVITQDKFTLEEIREKLSLLEIKTWATPQCELAVKIEITLNDRGILLDLLDGIRGEYNVLAKRNARQRNFRPIYEHETEELHFAA